MNRNFEHQHLDYIVIRPWIVKETTWIDPSNHYTAHLLPEDVQEEAKAARRLVSDYNYTGKMFPPSPTADDLIDFCESAIEGLPGAELQEHMTPLDVCTEALWNIDYFPTRLWNKNTKKALQRLKRAYRKLGGRGSYLGHDDGFNKFALTKAVEAGDVQKVGEIYRRHRGFVFRHPYIPLEMLEALEEAGMSVTGVAGINPNIGPILQRSFERFKASHEEKRVDGILKYTILPGASAITYDYERIANANQWLKEEIVAYFHQPKFVEAWQRHTGNDWKDYDPAFVLSSYKRVRDHADENPRETQRSRHC